jgi:RNA polymerase sigma-70 factor (ECF subfamily)
MVLNDSDADDVTQEVFLRVSRGIGRFRQEAKFSSWLHRIAVNTTMDFLRRRSRRPAGSRDEMPDLPDPQPGPAHLAASRELGMDIHDALSELSPRLRAAITMVAIQGMTTRDAAQACGCLPATLSWRVHQARKILREKLNHQGMS